MIVPAHDRRARPGQLVAQAGHLARGALVAGEVTAGRREPRDGHGRGGRRERLRGGRGGQRARLAVQQFAVEGGYERSRFVHPHVVERVTDHLLQHGSVEGGGAAGPRVTWWRGGGGGRALYVTVGVSSVCRVRAVSDVRRRTGGQVRLLVLRERGAE